MGKGVKRKGGEKKKEGVGEEREKGDKKGWKEGGKKIGKKK